MTIQRGGVWSTPKFQPATPWECWEYLFLNHIWWRRQVRTLKDRWRVLERAEMVLKSVRHWQARGWFFDLPVTEEIIWTDISWFM